MASALDRRCPLCTVTWGEPAGFPPPAGDPESAGGINWTTLSVACDGSSEPVLSRIPLWSALDCCPMAEGMSGGVAGRASSFRERMTLGSFFLFMPTPLASLQTLDPL